VGNGPSGNVAAETIAHVSLKGGLSGVSVRVRNPLPAVGGTAPEPIDDARLMAPEGLRSRRERAVTADDYAELAMRDHPSLQRAAGALRWTGSWYEALVVIDPLGSEEASPALRCAVERRLERYRRIGHDLRVEGARYVPLHVIMKVCAKPEFLRAHVRKAVMDALVGTAAAPGFFHPDHLTFGQAVSLSALVAAVQAVPGVLDVQVTLLARMFEGDRGEIDDGELTVGPLEIVRLDNDPARPENGVIEIEMRGGR
jgi:predicted phage baseplate assembly protein